MSWPTLSQVVVCQPNGGSASVSPCADANGVSYSPAVVTAFVDVASPSDTPFDATLAGGLFAWGFGGCLLMYMLGKSIRWVLVSLGIRF